MKRDLMYNHGVGLGKYRVGSLIDSDYCPVVDSEKAGLVFNLTETGYGCAAEMNGYIYNTKSAAFYKYSMSGVLVKSLSTTGVTINTYSEIFVDEKNNYIYVWTSNKIYKYEDKDNTLKYSITTLSMTPTAVHYDPVSNSFLLGYISGDKSYIDFYNDNIELTQTVCITDTMFNRFGRPSVLSYDAENQIIYASDTTGTTKAESLSSVMPSYSSSFGYSLKSSKLLFYSIDEVRHGTCAIKFFPSSKILYKCLNNNLNNVNPSFEVSVQLIDRYSGEMVKLIKSIKNANSADAGTPMSMKRSSSSNGMIVHAHRNTVHYYKISPNVYGTRSVVNICENVHAMQNNNSFIANTYFLDSSTYKSNFTKINIADIRKIIS